MIKLENDLNNERGRILKAEFKRRFGVDYSKRIIDQVLGFARVHGPESLSDTSRGILDYSIGHNLVSPGELKRANQVYLERYSPLREIFN